MGARAGDFALQMLLLGGDGAIPNYSLLTPPISWSRTSWPSCFRQPGEGQALALRCRVVFFASDSPARDRPSSYGRRGPHSVGQDRLILPVRDREIPNYGLFPGRRGFKPRLREAPFCRSYSAGARLITTNVKSSYCSVSPTNSWTSSTMRLITCSAV